MQTVTKLLLLAMFAFAARYAPHAQAAARNPDMQRLEAGHQYALDARKLLSAFSLALGSREQLMGQVADTLYEESRPSVCQALLLLGLREFGLGSLAQGWMYVGEFICSCRPPCSL